MVDLFQYDKQTGDFESDMTNWDIMSTLSVKG